MRTIKSEFINKGMAPPEPVPPLGEFLSGEIQFTRAADIGSLIHSLYHRPHHQPLKRPRHGRTKTWEVKKEMDAKKIDRNNAGLRILDFLYKQGGNYSNLSRIDQGLAGSGQPVMRGTISGFLSQAKSVKIIDMRPVKGGRGFEYRLVDQALPAEATYLRFRDAMSAFMAARKGKPAKTAPAAKPAPAGKPVPASKHEATVMDHIADMLQHLILRGLNINVTVNVKFN